MNPSPYVSIICPTLRTRALYREMLLSPSFNNQSYDPKRLELILLGEIGVDGETVSPSHARVVTVSDRASVAQKFKLGIERYARGDYVMLWGDDDLQHPDRVTESIRQLGDAPMGGWACGLFYSMETGRVSEHCYEPDRLTAASATIVRRDIAIRAAEAFGSTDPYSDTRWLRKCLELVGEEWVLFDSMVHSIWTVHEENMTKRNYYWKDWEIPEEFVPDLQAARKQFGYPSGV